MPELLMCPEEYKQTEVIGFFFKLRDHLLKNWLKTGENWRKLVKIRFFSAPAHIFCYLSQIIGLDNPY
jgi:hypothetical protein